jgi:hypothetical protein
MQCDWVKGLFCPVGYSHRRDVLLGSLPRHEALPPKLKRDWSLVVDKFGVSSGGDLKLVRWTKPPSRNVRLRSCTRGVAPVKVKF